jgi:hypothetical protein
MEGPPTAHPVQDTNCQGCLDNRIAQRLRRLHHLLFQGDTLAGMGLLNENQLVFCR